MKLNKFFLLAALLAVAPAARANLICTPTYVFSADANGRTAGRVYESIATTPGMMYQISFQGSISTPYQPTCLNFTFGDLVGASLTADMSQQYYQWYFHHADTSATSFNYLCTATTANTTLAFQYGLASENYGVFIKNLSVVPVPDATTTVTLLALAVAGLGCVRRWPGKAR